MSRYVIRAGWGYDTREGGFRRLAVDTYVRMPPTPEHAKAGHLIVYSDDGERMHVQRRALERTEDKPGQA